LEVSVGKFIDFHNQHSMGIFIAKFTIVSLFLSPSILSFVLFCRAG
jgi:hypothetical protein